MKILITAFDPFGGDKVNPALEAVKLMKDTIAGAQIVKLEIPTVFNKSIDLVVKTIDEVHPDVVLNVGQAGGRFEVTPERVAINVDDARIKDNEGNQPIDQPIAKDGAPAYFATLPVKAMVQAIKEVELPSSLSNSAGTFVCNHIMYGTLHHIAKNHLNIRAGFIHVPFIPEQVVGRPAPAPSLSTADIVRALEAAVQAIVEHTEDIVAVGGKTE
ncbi:pyroglutamyl-peptidase I [Proteiniclasticum sp. BAD-10]|uniref:Pyrrolidone-carboxylate peptidase n=1 Tax=Proteiniclasticum sediminis TaxID=2804028 RepID=A0A941CP72_9CLOT|nr:pyroglutamyl-peptidase I [Proteiniclasticum sediminis]MBR0575119.1 pyroglutamyl-peptidase I [Proteiniclasticum sediminis]